MDDALRFALAGQLLRTYGGYPERAWDEAGRQLASEPRDLRQLFIDAASQQDAVAAILSA